MNKLTQPQGLYIPICTPMYRGSFDQDSYKSLMLSVENNVDGFVPCLSSGEGHKMDVHLRKQVLSATLENTSKPVYVGIKRDTKKEVIELLSAAKELGATGITTPVTCKDQNNIGKYVKELSKATDLPIIIYNTETDHINDMKTLLDIDKLHNIVAIKDSSMNDEFFASMITSKKLGELKMSVFQGMEHKLKKSLDADGFLISLANLESSTCKEYLELGDEKLDKIIGEYFWQYNLGGERYISIKAILMAQGIIQSAEEINPFINP